jgi:hypothetical protein
MNRRCWFSWSVLSSCETYLYQGIICYDYLDFEQLDVKITFMYDEMEEMIYMHQLEGFISQGNESHMCLLKKLLYRLKQSSRWQYKRSYTFMLRYVRVIMLCTLGSLYTSCCMLKTCW